LRARSVALTATTLAGICFLGHGAYIHAKAQLAQVLLHSAWQRTLDGAMRVKPWPWADTWPVARLRAAAHDFDAIVLAGDSGRVLAFGPGANFGYAWPGAAGTSVISAHRDTHFRFLRELRLGEFLEVEDAGGRWQRYRVTAARVVDARVTFELPENPTSQLILITCYPFDAIAPGGPLRYVVSAIAAPAA
jgi:sortase A